MNSRNCTICDDEYQPVHKFQKTCSKPCRDEHERQKSREYNRSYYHRIRSGAIPRQWERICVLCGSEFTTNSELKRTCYSTACMDLWSLPRVRHMVAAGGCVLQVIDRDRRRVLQRYRNCCAYCGVRLSRSRGPRQLEWDHVVPVSAGGRHSIGNLLPTCRACNRGKLDDYLIVWLQYLVETRRTGHVANSGYISL